MGKEIKTFGYLKLIGKTNEKAGDGSYYYELECSCGKRIKLRGWQIKHYRSCGCQQRKTASKHKDWKGCGKIYHTFFHVIERNARRRGIDVEITINDIWELYLKQRGICALSGLPIGFGERSKHPSTASLDRIDSSKGYTKDNIQWVHKRINFMKNDYIQSEFLALCKRVADFNLTSSTSPNII